MIVWPCPVFDLKDGARQGESEERPPNEEEDRGPNEGPNPSEVLEPKTSLLWL